MVYIVVGGAGYIGSHLVAALLSEKKRVICLDSLINSYSSTLPSHENLTLITDDDYKYTDCEPVEGIIHAAGLKHIPESVKSPLDYYENNVGVTRKVLDLMAETDCKLLVMLSTTAIYGGGSPYSRSMFACEAMVRDVAQNAPAGTFFYILRLTNVYGGKENPKNKAGLVPSLLKAIQTGTSFTLRVQPNGTSLLRDFIHIRDVIRAIRVCLGFQMGEKFKTYNIGSGKLIEVVSFVAICMRQAPTLVVEKAVCLPEETEVAYQIDTERFQLETGWVPQWSDLEKYHPFAN